jgi:hypothetical protein
MHRKPFFPPPNQRDKSRSRVTEHTLHGGEGPKAGERVRVHQAASFAYLAHRAIMPNFPPQEAPFFPMKIGNSNPASPIFTHRNWRRAHFLLKPRTEQRHTVKE